MRRYMDCCSQWWRSALRGVGAGANRRIAQDTLGNLLFRRYTWSSILSRRPWLRIVRGIWGRVR
jgi:hypothetical protein